MKKIQFILMASFVLGTCQLAVLSGAADELDVREVATELASDFVENGEVGSVQDSSETDKGKSSSSIITDRSG
mgnify:CR=1 FL=1